MKKLPHRQATISVLIFILALSSFVYAIPRSYQTIVKRMINAPNAVVGTISDTEHNNDDETTVSTGKSTGNTVRPAEPQSTTITVASTIPTAIENTNQQMTTTEMSAEQITTTTEMSTEQMTTTEMSTEQMMTTTEMSTEQMMTTTSIIEPVTNTTETTTEPETVFGEHLIENSPQFYDDFNSTPSSKWDYETANDQYSATIVDSYAVEGKSLRIELRQDDPIVHGSKRSELALFHWEKPAEEHVYKVNIMLPKGGDEDYSLDPHGSEIILQWHTIPDEGELHVYPPLALRTWGGDYVLERFWDDAPITSTTQIKEKGNQQVINLGSYEADKGRFVEWEFRIKWGWQDSQTPRIVLYKDGQLIQDIVGPNTMNDQRGNIMKIGIYKWDWAQDETLNNSILDKRVIYYDDVSVY